MVDTPLTHYLKLNQTNEDVRDLYYYQMPQFYVWNKAKHIWTKRKQYDLIILYILFQVLISFYSKKDRVIGRMYFVHPADNERFALRMLLLYRKGCSSFKQLRTVNNITYSTFKETCCALGYAKDDNESKQCLQEAVLFSNSNQMRKLFVLILLNCCPTNPRQLWELFKDHMSEDILQQFRLKYNNPTLERFNAIYNIALNKINIALQKSGNDLSNYANMPEVYEPFELNEREKNTSNLIKDEISYDAEQLKKDLINDLPKMNKDQKFVYNTIINRFNKPNHLGTIYFFVKFII